MGRLFVVRLVKAGNPFIPDNNHLHHLLLNKFNIFLTNIILLTMIFLPLLVNLYFKNSLLLELIIFQVLFYSLLIAFLKNLKMSSILDRKILIYLFYLIPGFLIFGPLLPELIILLINIIFLIKNFFYNKD